MFRADYFPELGSDLVAALATLDVEDFSHVSAGKVRIFLAIGEMGMCWFRMSLPGGLVFDGIFQKVGYKKEGF